MTAVLRLPPTSARASISSLVRRPAPHSRATSRKGALVAPAMGARRRSRKLTPVLCHCLGMRLGFHVGQVVPQGYDLQRQWLEHLEQVRAARDAGFSFVSWGHHWLIHPFQHFQPIPVLARLAAEVPEMELATGVLLTPLLNPVQVAEDIATL